MRACAGLCKCAVLLCVAVTVGRASMADTPRRRESDRLSQVSTVPANVQVFCRVRPSKTSENVVVLASEADAAVSVQLPDDRSASQSLVQCGNRLGLQLDSRATHARVFTGNRLLSTGFSVVMRHKRLYLKLAVVTACKMLWRESTRASSVAASAPCPAAM